jgi:filamin
LIVSFYFNQFFIDYFFFLGVFLESPTEFTVDAKSVTGSGAGRVECLLTSPSGRVVRCPVKNMADGTYQVQYAPYEQGNYHKILKNIC